MNKSRRSTSIQNIKNSSKLNDLLRFLFRNHILILFLRPILINIGSPVVFCHNDLSVNNILMLPNKLMAIDYEFSCYNYRGFDFGLYFSEAAFNNHSSKYPYFEFDFEKYPNKDQQLNFVRSYIDKIRKNAIETSIKSHNAYLKLDEEVIIYEANMFALIAFLYAALWSTIQSTQSSHNFGFLVIFFLKRI